MSWGIRSNGLFPCGMITAVGFYSKPGMPECLLGGQQAQSENEKLPFHSKEICVHRMSRILSVFWESWGKLRSTALRGLYEGLVQRKAQSSQPASAECSLGQGPFVCPPFSPSVVALSVRVSPRHRDLINVQWLYLNRVHNVFVWRNAPWLKRLMGLCWLEQMWFT